MARLGRPAYKVIPMKIHYLMARLVPPMVTVYLAGVASLYSRYASARSPRPPDRNGAMIFSLKFQFSRYGTMSKPLKHQTDTELDSLCI